jgi:hypothetical protein
MVLAKMNNSIQSSQYNIVLQVLGCICVYMSIHILIHSKDRIMDTLEKLKRNKEIRALELQTFLQMKLSTIIQDRKFSLEIEVKDDINLTFQKLLDWRLMLIVTSLFHPTWHKLLQLREYFTEMPIKPHRPSWRYALSYRVI